MTPAFSTTHLSRLPFSKDILLKLYSRQSSCGDDKVYNSAVRPASDPHNTAHGNVNWMSIDEDVCWFGSLATVQRPDVVNAHDTNSNWK